MIFVYNLCSASRKCQYLTTGFDRSVTELMFASYLEQLLHGIPFKHHVGGDLLKVVETDFASFFPVVIFENLEDFGFFNLESQCAQRHFQLMVVDGTI